MPLMNATTSTARPEKATDVIPPAPASRRVPHSGTETRTQNEAQGVGAYVAGLANEQHAEQAIHGIQEVLEPYDE